MLNNKSNINDLISSLAEDISLETLGVDGAQAQSDILSIENELTDIWDASKAYKSEVTFNSQNAFNAFKDSVANLEPDLQVATETPVVSLKRKYQYLTGIAASAALLIGAWFLYPSDTITYNNDSSTTQQFALVDGSSLFLFPGASLEIGKSFSEDNRNISLNSGQVIVDVESSKVPFVLNMDKNEIIVTGTKFSASFGNEDIIVNLYEGAINYEFDSQIVECTQGTQLVHDLKTGEVNRIMNVDQSLLDFVNGTLSFIDTPLDDVFDRLEQFYNVEFTQTKKFDQDLHFTSAVLANQSLDNIIKTLEVSFNLNIKKVDESLYSVQF